MRTRFLLLAGTTLALAGCATVPAEPEVPADEVVAAEPAEPEAEASPEDPGVNELGEEVPKSAPSEAVDEGGLGDIG